MGGDFAFDLGHTRERLVPARLEFAGHQPIGRIGGIVLAEGAIGCVARRFEIALEGFAHLVPLLAGLCLGGNGGRDGARAHHGEKRILNGVIDPQTAKGDATRLAIVHPATAAAVARDAMLGTRVPKRQLASTAATAEQARRAKRRRAWARRDDGWWERCCSPFCGSSRPSPN